MQKLEGIKGIKGIKDKIIKKGRSLVRRGKFEDRRLRLRNSCPECNSVAIVKRRKCLDYICRRCGWNGKVINKIIWPQNQEM